MPAAAAPQKVRHHRWSRTNIPYQGNGKRILTLHYQLKAKRFNAIISQTNTYHQPAWGLADGMYLPPCLLFEVLLQFIWCILKSIYSPLVGVCHHGERRHDIPWMIFYCPLCWFILIIVPPPRSSSRFCLNRVPTNRCAPCSQESAIYVLIVLVQELWELHIEIYKLMLSIKMTVSYFGQTRSYYLTIGLNKHINKNKTETYIKHAPLYTGYKHKACRIEHIRLCSSGKSSSSVL